MTVAYATVLDVGYLVRGLCLYESLLRHPGDKLFLFYCVDDEAAEILEALSLPRSRVVRRASFETPALLSLRKQRSRSEYCWTLKPVIVEHAMAAIDNIAWAVYLDSDMMGFGDPDRALVATPSSDVLLAPHRFTHPLFAGQEPIVGQFNAGYVAFRPSQTGQEALAWWRDRCLELCPRVPTNGIYADQTYLDHLPKLWTGAVASGPRGLNAAPWNVIDADVRATAGVPLIDGEELLLFHFQSLRILGERYFETYAGEFQLTANVMDTIYVPYLKALRRALELLRTVRPGFSAGIEPWQRHPLRVLRMVRRSIFGPNNYARVSDAA